LGFGWQFPERLVLFLGLFFFIFFIRNRGKSAFAVELGFDDLDIKFITLAAQFFHEKVYKLWEQGKLLALQVGRETVRAAGDVPDGAGAEQGHRLTT
jgi:hypothetical protein